ncbi:hypothetical protein ACJEC8_01055 [Candidatus Carsonella ruddii]|uniref:hypothetical protein n=1 Tax=Carsonella ruddii TaxID=114186 RepID=UPI003D4755F5
MNKILFNKKNYKFFYNFIINYINIKKNNFKKKILFNLKFNKIILFLEYKKQSPYKGLYKKNIFDTIKKYEILGCFCLSILNECFHFKCNFIDFYYIKKYSNMFLLRKDFLFNEIQVFQSYLIGYNIILLLSSLNIILIKKIYFICKKLKIFIILEIHNLKELKKINIIKPIFLGINCRNLKNLIINKIKILNIIKKLPKNAIIISESGINIINNIKFFIDNNIRVFLIGDFFLSNFNLYKKFLTLLK